jgi:hypothetical protein
MHHNVHRVVTCNGTLGPTMITKCHKRKFALRVVQIDICAGDIANTDGIDEKGRCLAWLLFANRGASFFRF